MKVVIAGSRDLSVDHDFLRGLFKAIEIDNGYEGFLAATFNNLYASTSQIISGGANGIDNCGASFAQGDIQFAGRQNILKVFPADWEKYGKAAGPIRNKQMAEYADVAVVIHNGSAGSKNMIEQMKKLNKPVYEVILKAHNV